VRVANFVVGEHCSNPLKHEVYKKVPRKAKRYAGHAWLINFNRCGKVPKNNNFFGCHSPNWAVAKASGVQPTDFPLP